MMRRESLRKSQGLYEGNVPKQEKHIVGRRKFSNEYYNNEAQGKGSLRREAQKGWYSDETPETLRS